MVELPSRIAHFTATLDDALRSLVHGAKLIFAIVSTRRIRVPS